MPFEAIKDELEQLGIGGIDRSFWDVVKTNITRISDVKEWWGICKEPIAPIIEDKAFIEEAGTLLPEGRWTETTWSAWVSAIQAKTGRKEVLIYASPSSIDG